MMPRFVMPSRDFHLWKKKLPFSSAGAFAKTLDQQARVETLGN